MQKLPRANYNLNKYEEHQFAFGGLKHLSGARDGEIYDMKNISLDDYPCLTVRKKRQLLDFDIKRRVYGIGSADKLFWCADDENGEAYFYYDGEKMFPVEKSEKNFAVINKYICIFPDKKYFSLWRDEVKGTYETLTELYEETAIDDSLNDGDIYLVGTEAPFSIFQFNSQGKWLGAKISDGMENYSKQTRWIYLMDSWGDMEGEFSVESKPNSDVGINFIKYDGEDIRRVVLTPPKYQETHWMRVGDCIKVTLIGEEKGYQYYVRIKTKSITKDGYYSYAFLFDKDIYHSGLKVKRAKLERVIPDLEFAFCHENRIWGIDGDKICASKLGDPFNFQDFSVLADASWQVAVASSGPFTGGIVYNGYPTFFKEDSIIRVAGSYPSQYSTYETNDVAGVLKGSEKSLAIANGALFYLSSQGVARYTGSYPSIVSDALGKVLSYGRAGAAADKYYLEAIDEEGEKAVYVLDTKINAWTKEDALFSAGFTDMGRELYAICEDGIYLIDSERELFNDSETIESFIEFAPIYEGSLKKKGLSKLLVNLSVKDGSKVRIYLSYDGGEWILMKKWSTGGIHTVPLTIKRCGNYRIRISGEGEYKLLALSRERYLGSERG